MIYEAVITESEYQSLRQANMRGKIAADFEMIDEVVRFKTKNPKQLCEELELIIDCGGTSWSEIFGINIYA